MTKEQHQKYSSEMKREINQIYGYLISQYSKAHFEKMFPMFTALVKVINEKDKENAR